MRRFRETLRLLRRLFPMTFPGLIFNLVAGVAFYRYGVRGEDLTLLVVGGVALLLSAVCLLSTLAAAIGLWLRLRAMEGGPALTPNAGEPVRTGFSLREPIAPFAGLRWRWTRPAAEVELLRAGWRIGEQVRLRGRGEQGEIERAITASDCFGFYAIELRHHQRAELRVNPAVGELRKVEVVQGMAGGDAVEHPGGEPVGDRLDMRRYADGDPIRYILWGVFARTRQLVVRTPERALSPARETVAYLLAGPDDEAAAGAARLAVEEGALGVDWVLGADGSPAPTAELDEAFSLIRRSAGAEGGRGLAEFLAGAPGRAVRRALLFCPATPGPWLDTVERVFRENPLVHGSFLVCVDGVGRAAPPAPRWRAWLWRPPELRPAASPAEVVRRLGALGGELSLLDRATGQVFSAAQLQHLVGS